MSHNIRDAEAYMNDFLIVEEGNMQFKIGDVVCLKSGGPEMTVSELTADGYIVAAWFGNADVPNYYKFEPEMLDLAADEDGFYDADEGAEDLSDVELDSLVAQSEYYKNRGH
jgi:uncharacterized protein YodC (DUF2158 family)